MNINVVIYVLAVAGAVFLGLILGFGLTLWGAPLLVAVATGVMFTVLSMPIIVLVALFLVEEWRRVVKS